MYQEIVGILKCPCCGTDFELVTEKEENGEIIEGKLICAHKHTYKIFAGVIDFGSEEQNHCAIACLGYGAFFDHNRIS